MRTAIYPGTFDPITLGHADVIQKSLKLCDRLIVATTNSKNKNYFFPIDERVKIIKKSLFTDLKLNSKKGKFIIIYSDKTRVKKMRCDASVDRICASRPDRDNKD